MELYEFIYAYTFRTTSPITELKIGRDYKPPSILLVDRESRVLTAMAYYPSITFAFGPPRQHDDSRFYTTCRELLGSLSSAHLELLTGIQSYLGFSHGLYYSPTQFDLDVSNLHMKLGYAGFAVLVSNPDYCTTWTPILKLLRKGRSGLVG